MDLSSQSPTIEGTTMKVVEPEPEQTSTDGRGHPGPIDLTAPLLRSAAG